MAKQLTILDETLGILREAREKSSSCLVSFSGGKDSLVVMDLCLRVFDRVEAFFMQLVPGLECVERPAIEAAEKFGVPLHMTPHWIAFRLLKGGMYCFEPQSRDAWPDVKLRDIYTSIIEETGIPLIATGAKRTDSLWRKRHLDSTKGWTEVVNPVVAWSKHEIVSHLTSRGWAVPKGDSGDGAGADLSRPAVLWMHDNHPEDFKLLEEHFPFVRSIVMQREWFGTGRSSATPAIASAAMGRSGRAGNSSSARVSAAEPAPSSVENGVVERPETPVVTNT